MFKFKTTVTSNFDKILDNFAKTKSMQKPLTQVKKILIDNNIKYFEKEQSPDGKKWPPHSEATIKYYAQKGLVSKGILNLSARLKNSIKSNGSWFIKGDTLEYRSGVFYAVYNQNGSPGGKMFGHPAPKPQRRHIADDPMGQDYNYVGKAIIEVFENHFIESFK